MSASVFLIVLWILKVTFVCVSGRVNQLVRGFNSEWKKAIEIINQDVMRSFTNFKNGTQILQVS